MAKKKDKKTPALPEPESLPSEASTAPESSGLEGVPEEKAPPAPPKKKKDADEIVGLMGVRHVQGPPGSWHG